MTFKTFKKLGHPISDGYFVIPATERKEKMKSKRTEWKEREIFKQS